MQVNRALRSRSRKCESRILKATKGNCVIFSHVAITNLLTRAGSSEILLGSSTLEFIRKALPNTNTVRSN